MLIDCNELRVEQLRFYGGLTGSKIAVWYNDGLYMLKCQQNLKLRSFKNVDLSYANDPITEYIGSHIYQLLGVPIHYTLLGTYSGKLCVLCKDFAYPDNVVEFKQLRNTLMEEGIVQHSSGMSTCISDIFEVIDAIEFINKEACYQRFYDMLVIDSLIGNTDRNNGNWGFIKRDKQLVLAPVYDCGGCLNNKHSASWMGEQLVNGKLRTLALDYTLNFLDEKGKRINPFKYIVRTYNTYLHNSLQTVSKLKMSDVIKLLCSIGDVLDPNQRLFYTSILDIRLCKLRSLLKRGD